MAYTTIKKPSDYFNTKLYTGNGGTQSITGLDFQPDWTWIKNRTAVGEGHHLYDAVRGVEKRLRSDSTSAESTVSTGLTTFGTDGFTVGSNAGVNGNGNGIASWNWKAGTAVSGNTTGSGTYKTYTGSVNTTSGFSIIKYVGNGTAGHTIPHNLGAVPKMIIVKDLSVVSEFKIYSAELANTEMLVFSNQAKWTSRTEWNSTTPTSTVFSLGNQANVNTNDRSYIAYCFAEKQGYSKFGSYTGNGSTDGTFVYTGFKPAFLMIKSINLTESWFMYDTKRSTYNVVENYLFANLSNAEETSTANSIDILSNGFKIRTTDSRLNTSGSYIYMAFAEQPLVGDNPATAR